MRTVVVVKMLTIKVTGICEAFLMCQVLSGVLCGGYWRVGSPMSRWDSCGILVSFEVIHKSLGIIKVKILKVLLICLGALES